MIAVLWVTIAHAFLDYFGRKGEAKPKLPKPLPKKKIPAETPVSVREIKPTEEIKELKSMRDLKVPSLIQRKKKDKPKKGEEDTFYTNLEFLKPENKGGEKKQ